MSDPRAPSSAASSAATENLPESASDDELTSATDLSELAGVDGIRRNPKLANLFKSVAFITGLTAFILPGASTGFEDNPETIPVWATIAFLVLIPVTIVAGMIGSYYGKAPREVQFQEKLDKVKRNLDEAIALMTVLNEEILKRTKLFNTLNEKDRRQRLIENSSPEQVRAVAKEVADQYKKMERHHRWVREITLLVVGLALGVVGNWVATPLLAYVSQLLQ